MWLSTHRDKVNGKVASNDFKQVLCENTLRGKGEEEEGE